MVWDVRQHETHKIELHYSSNDAWSDVLPNFYVKLLYSLNDQNCLTITCEASTGQMVLINHPSDIFFNLNGNKDNSVLKHQLLIRADSYLPVSYEQKPLGCSEAVVGTPFDFRNSATIGARLNDHHTVEKWKWLLPLLFIKQAFLPYSRGEG